MITYAGIGSRSTTPEERAAILTLAKDLAALGAVLFSGNADGTDVTFQEGSGGRCVIMLPYLSFNRDRYDTTKSLAAYDLGKSKRGLAAIDTYHPAPRALTFGGRCMMARNFHQVMGVEAADVGMGTSVARGQVREYTGPAVLWVPASFVIACATENEQGIIGGTGQAARIAKARGVPVFNLRTMTVAKIRDEIENLPAWRAA